MQEAHLRLLLPCVVVCLPPQIYSTIKNAASQHLLSFLFVLTRSGRMVIKMTVEHSYSPFGHKIDKVGITPDVVIQQTDPLKAAELMLSDKTVALAMARISDYWEAWGEMSNSVAVNDNSEFYSLYYPNYRNVSELSAIPLDKKFTVHFTGMVDKQSVNNTSLELINSKTGERTPAKFEMLVLSDVQVIPNVALNPDATYWLVIHPSVEDVNGLAMKEVKVVLTIAITEEE